MTRRGWLGYGVLGIVVVVVSALYVDARRSIRNLQTNIALVQSENETLTAEHFDVETLEEKLEAAESEIQRLGDGIERAKNMVALLEASVDETLLRGTSDGDVDEMLDDADSDADGPSSRMQDILKSMDPDAMAKMQATNVVSMGYRRLFRELGLDAQTEASARAIILEETEGQMREMFARMQDGDDAAPGDDPGNAESLRQTIRERLGTLLVEDQLQILDDYDVDYEMIAGGIEIQLTIYAPGLSDESAALARDVVVEEILANIEETVAAGEEEDRSEWERQIESIRNAEARLSEMLSEDEMIRFRRYVEQHMAMAESMRAMMEDIDKDEE